MNFRYPLSPFELVPTDGGFQKSLAFMNNQIMSKSSLAISNPSENLMQTESNWFITKMERMQATTIS